MSTPAYPAAERQEIKLFALTYTKALFRSDGIRIAGRDAVLLAAFIAAREDDLRFRQAPRFWRAEIMDRFAIASPKDFIRIRNRAIEEGLLEYVEGDRITPASYWVLIPDWLADHMGDPFPKRNAKPELTSSQTGTDDQFSRSQNGTHSGTDQGTDEGTDQGTLSSPSPIPVPDPKKKKVANATGPVSDRARQSADGEGFEFPLVSGTWRLSDAKLAEYRKTYQWDIDPELRKAAQWLRDNRERRPRAGTGTVKFITRWLNREDGKQRRNPSINAGPAGTGKSIVEETLAQLQAINARKAQEVPV